MKKTLSSTKFWTIAILTTLATACLQNLQHSNAFTFPSVPRPTYTNRNVQREHRRNSSHCNSPVMMKSSPSDDNPNEGKEEKEEEAARLKAKAQELREQIRQMEEKLGDRRSNQDYKPPPPPEIIKGKSLKNKRVLVVGANGRVGSMVVRYLLRNFPDVKEVVAAVHYVGEATTRGYGRLSYEVGAEDGIGTIGAAWSPEEERTASFMFSDEMKEYNLQNLRVVEVELLDPLQCTTITQDVDSVIWCATDFNGNKPRAISGLNVAFLFRAAASPTKGRVEIEGLTNILGGLKQSKQDQRRKDRLSGSSTAGISDSDVNSSSLDGPNDPTSFIMLSPAPNAFQEFETPFGEFNGLKRQGERILREDFPSLSHCILQMGKYEDNFVEESLDILFEGDEGDVSPDEKRRRKINRRDAARAAADALLDENLEGKTVEVWTALHGR